MRITELAVAATKTVLNRLERRERFNERKVTEQLAPSSIHEYIGESAFTNPDTVLARFGEDTYAEMVERDEEVYNGLEELIAGVTSTPWRIVPADDTPQAEEHAQFVEQVIKGIGVSVPTTFQTMQGFFDELNHAALMDGLAVGEKVWRITPDRRVVLCHVAFKQAKDFRLQVDDYGNLTGIVSQAASAMNEPIPMSRLVVYPYQAWFQNWYGNSKLQHIWRLYHLKKTCLASLSIFVQKAGSGALIAKIPESSYNRWKSAILAAVQKINSETATVLPQWAEITNIIEGGQLTASVFEKTVDLCNRGMRVGLLGSTLGTDVGQSGSRALGKTHSDTRETRVALLRKLEGAVIQSQIIEPLCDLNYATSDPSWPGYPQFRRVPVKQRDLESYSSVLVRLSNIGARFRPAWVAEVFDAELANDEDEELQIQPGAGALPDGIGAFQSGDLTVAKLAEGKVEQRRRESQRLLYAHIERGSLAMEPHYRDLIRWVQEHQSEVATGAWLDDADRREELRAELDATMEEAVKLVADMKGEVLAADDWQYGDFIPESAIDSLGDLIEGRYFDEFEANLREDMMALIAEGYREGWSNEELARRLALKAGLDPDELETGAEYGEKNWRMRLQTRTMFDEAYNSAKWRAGQAASWVAGYEYSAVVDNRTTPFCLEHNGRVFQKDDQELATIVPPNHWHCRSDMIPLFADEMAAAVPVASMGTTPDAGFDDPPGTEESRWLFRRGASSGAGS